MIELFFVTCMMSAPQTCQERVITDHENRGIMACLMAAQPKMAEWTVDHPGHRIARWSCRMVSRDEMKA